MAKVELTKELKEKLYGLLPMGDEAIEYIPDIFDTANLTEEEAEQVLPVVKIRQFTNGEVKKFKQQLTEELQESNSKKKKKTIPDTKGIQVDLIKDAVLDIKNLINVVTGEDISYEGEATLLQLPEVLIADITRKIAEISGFIPKNLL